MRLHVNMLTGSTNIEVSLRLEGGRTGGSIRIINLRRRMIAITMRYSNFYFDVQMIWTIVLIDKRRMLVAI